jgi:hypothetical protein
MTIEELPDAHRITRDVGPVDAYTPPPPDAQWPDAGPLPDAWSRDARVLDVGSDGGGSSPVVVDGRLDDAVWSTAIERSTDLTSFGPYSGTQLTRFLYVRTRDELAIAFEGTFPLASTTVCVFLDVDYPNVTDGVLLSPSGLGDRTGQVDSVLSNSLTATDATFRPELGWGGARRPESVTAGSPTLGWRALRQTEAHVLVLAQRSACTATACETVLPLSVLGVPATRQIAFAVRVGSFDILDSWAPLQTIPNDPDPEYVSVVEIVPAVE